MAKTFLLHIATPERDFFQGQVESVRLRTIDGEMGVLPGHLALVVALVDAEALQFQVSGGESYIAAISGGFARIRGDQVHIFADTAEWPEEIEENRAIEAKKRAEERLQLRASEVEYMQSRVALDRALVRLSVKHADSKFM
jgi:F-type H+-transporting ATPase subunit epsilon